MTTLRVLVSAVPDSARPDAWTLVDARGRVVQRGRTVRAEWPAADRRVAVVAAEAVRLMTLSLPPLPRARLVSAATYALEDRLATPAGDAAIAIGERDTNGRVSAVVLARDLADALGPWFARAIAEPQLAPVSDGWRWCEGVGGGFVRTADGSAFPVSRTSDGALPPELSLGLAQAARSKNAPPYVIVDRQAAAEEIAAWTHATGVPFRAGTPWDWETADAAAYASATDLIAALQRARATPATTTTPRYATALAIGGTALVLHLVAAAGTWAWQRFALARAERALVPLAEQAGARDATAGNAADAIARVHAAARHRAGLTGPADAMPLLARAAPALAALPAGALKSATFSGGAWTLELAPVDEATIDALAGRLAADGLAALHARNAAGVRARVGPLP